jgi:hypothetical protein
MAKSLVRDEQCELVWPLIPKARAGPYSLFR